MQRRKLGENGPEVSAEGLGCMGMSMSYGTPDDAESIRTIHRAIDLGCDFLDTAEVYGAGKNEALLGEALKGKRDKVFLATKFGMNRDRPHGVDGRPENVHRAIDGSLKRLGTDVVDLYYLHRVDPDTPIEETVGAMAELVKAGKVRYLGLSEAGPDTLRRASAVHAITALQSEYSLWTRNCEADVLPTCRELGVGYVAYSPLGRGFLTGEFTSTDDLIEGDRRHEHPRWQDENFERNLELLAILRDMAASKNATPAQLAIAWVLSNGPDIVPIPGTKKVAYLEQNIAAAELTLSAEELIALDEAFPPGVTSGERYPENMQDVLQM